jgi:hypothetical protein
MSSWSASSVSTAMSSALAFNDVFHEFFLALTEVFPENVALQRYLQGFDELRAINCKKPREIFVDIITKGKYAEKIFSRDERVFETLELPGLKFNTMWTDDISTGTKTAIWDYFQKLLSLC